MGADVEAVAIRFEDALEQRDDQLVVADVGADVRRQQRAPHRERLALEPEPTGQCPRAAHQRA